MSRPRKTTKFITKQNQNLEEYIKTLDYDLDQLYEKFNSLLCLNKLRVGSTNDYTQIGSGGDLTFVGGAGLSHGSMFNDNNSTKVDINAVGVNTPVRIPSGFTVGQTHLMTFQNAREIVVSLEGMYLITWQISFSTDGNSKEIEGFIMIDNVRNAQASAHRFIGTAADTGSMSGTCILDLSADAVVALGVTNKTAGGDLDVNIEHANLSIIQVGGT
jgi:hypothetical protein